jgi:hypothetical protein
VTRQVVNPGLHSESRQAAVGTIGSDCPEFARWAQALARLAVRG